MLLYNKVCEILKENNKNDEYTETSTTDIKNPYKQNIFDVKGYLFFHRRKEVEKKLAKMIAKSEICNLSLSNYSKEECMEMKEHVNKTIEKIGSYGQRIFFEKDIECMEDNNLNICLVHDLRSNVDKISNAIHHLQVNMRNAGITGYYKKMYIIDLKKKGININLTKYYIKYHTDNLINRIGTFDGGHLKFVEPGHIGLVSNSG